MHRLMDSFCMCWWFNTGFQLLSMEQHTDLLQSHWQNHGINSGLPTFWHQWWGHLVVSMHSLDSLIFFKHVPSCPYLRASVYSSFTYFFNSSAFIFPPCVQIRLCNWKIPVGQLIVASFSSQSPSLSLSPWKAWTQLEPRRLKRGAWERRNKVPSICSYHHSALPLLSLSLFLPLFFPPSVTLSPLPTGQRPKLRLQTRKWAQ